MLEILLSETTDFKNWAHKDGYYSVQPPVDILENICTIRIHLDDTDANNGALKVIAASHTQGVVRSDEFDTQNKDADICSLQAGGIMLMKPLLFHSSARTNNDKRRRVIHLELSDKALHEDMQWSESVKL